MPLRVRHDLVLCADRPRLGTTSFRAYRLASDGGVIETKSAPSGILKVPAGRFEHVFEREIGPWLAVQPDLPVIAAGMITSRQGWVEVPYCPCPAGSDEIARALWRHETGAGRTIHFVPGLSIVGADGVPDVIRGEETQIVGEVGGAPGSRLLVLPGRTANGRSANAAGSCGLPPS